MCISNLCYNHLPSAKSFISHTSRMASSKPYQIPPGAILPEGVYDPLYHDEWDPFWKYIDISFNPLKQPDIDFLESLSATYSLQNPNLHLPLNPILQDSKSNQNASISSSQPGFAGKRIKSKGKPWSQSPSSEENPLSVKKQEGDTIQVKTEYTLQDNPSDSANSSSTDIQRINEIILKRQEEDPTLTARINSYPITQRLIASLIDEGPGVAVTMPTGKVKNAIHEENLWLGLPYPAEAPSSGGASDPNTTPRVTKIAVQNTESGSLPKPGEAEKNPAVVKLENSLNNNKNQNQELEAKNALEAEKIRKSHQELLEKRVKAELISCGLLPGSLASQDNDGDVKMKEEDNEAEDEDELFQTEIRATQWELRNILTINRFHRNSLYVKTIDTGLNHQAKCREVKRVNQDLEVAYLERMIKKCKKNKRQRSKFQRVLTMLYPNYKVNKEGSEIKPASVPPPGKPENNQVIRKNKKKPPAGPSKSSATPPRQTPQVVASKLNTNSKSVSSLKNVGGGGGGEPGLSKVTPSSGGSESKKNVVSKKASTVTKNVSAAKASKADSKKASTGSTGFSSSKSGEDKDDKQDFPEVANLIAAVINNNNGEATLDEIMAEFIATHPRYEVDAARKRILGCLSLSKKNYAFRKLSNGKYGIVYGRF